MKTLALVCVVGLLTLFADRAGALHHLRGTLERASFQFVFSAGLAREAVKQPGYLMQSKYDLMQQVIDLRAQNAELIASQETQARNQQEFETWKESHQLNEHLIPTSLILTDRSIVPVGSNQGVAVGAMVLAHGSMIGQISEVYPQLSSVELLENTTEKLPVRLREVNTVGLLQHEEKNLVVSHMSVQAHMQAGQIVTTVGQVEGVLPFIPVGRIQQVISMSSEPFQTAIVELLVQPTNGMGVSVLQTAKEAE
jgi:rod shape-determining protein MreC